MFDLLARLTGRKQRGQYLPERIADTEFTVIDLEMTGLDPKKDAIIAFGGVKMIGGRIDLGRTFYSLACPGTSLKADSICVHQLTPDLLECQPSLDTTLERFLGFCGSSVLVGYCLELDLAFLDTQITRRGAAKLGNARIDVRHLFDSVRKLQVSTPWHELALSQVSLTELAECTDIDVDQAHDALADAFVTAQVFQRAMAWLRQEEEMPLSALIRSGSAASAFSRQQPMGGVF